jgi:hypothetical protein
MSMGTRHVSIPDPNLTVLITNSNVKHALEGGCVMIAMPAVPCCRRRISFGANP